MAERGHIAVELGLYFVGVDDVLLEDEAVEVALSGELGAGFVELMAMVKELDGLLKADGDEQADDDGRDVGEEVSPGVGGRVGRVDVEHSELLLCSDEGPKG
jgi:hypothetical protein